MPRRATVDGAVQRYIADNVVTPGELTQLTSIQEAKNGPEALPAKLDQYQGKMTPLGADRYAAFKAALPQGGGNALQILSGQVQAPAVLPAWYPANFDLQRAAIAFKQLLTHQAQNRGKDPDAFA